MVSSTLVGSPLLSPAPSQIPFPHTAPADVASQSAGQEVHVSSGSSHTPLPQRVRVREAEVSKVGVEEVVGAEVGTPTRGLAIPRTRQCRASVLCHVPLQPDML
eukprot:scaffold348462_cov62-Attheya_sp.AAC.7